jgi:hypothetical protein
MTRIAIDLRLTPCVSLFYVIDTGSTGSRGRTWDCPNLSTLHPYSDAASRPNLIQCVSVTVPPTRRAPRQPGRARVRDHDHERNTLASKRSNQSRFFNDQMAGRPLAVTLGQGRDHSEHQGFDIRPVSVDARARLSVKATRAARSTLSISDPGKRRGKERAEQYKRADRRNLFGESLYRQIQSEEEC